MIPNQLTKYSSLKNVRFQLNHNLPYDLYHQNLELEILPFSCLKILKGILGPCSFFSSNEPFLQVNLSKPMFFVENSV